MHTCTNWVLKSTHSQKLVFHFQIFVFLFLKTSAIRRKKNIIRYWFIVYAIIFNYYHNGVIIPFSLKFIEYCEKNQHFVRSLVRHLVWKQNIFADYQNLIIRHSSVFMRFLCKSSHKDRCAWPCIIWKCQPIKLAEYNQWSPLLRLL